MSISKVLLLALLLPLTNLSAQKTTKINFKISGYTEGGTVKLLGSLFDQNYLADTVRLSPDGSASFTNAEGFKEGMYYLLTPDKNNFQFIIAGGENDFTLKTSKDNLVLGMSVVGSIENKLLYDNARYQTALEAKYNALSQQLKAVQPNTPQYVDLSNQQKALLEERDAKLQTLKKEYPNALFTKFKLAGQNPKIRMEYRANGSLDSSATMFNYRRDWWNDVDFTDGRLLRTPVFFTKLKRYIQEFTTQHQDSLIAAADYLLPKTLTNDELFNATASWIASQYKPGQAKIMDGEAVYAHVVLKYFTPDKVKDISKEDLESTRKRAAEMLPSLLGKTGQDVWGVDKNNQRRNLYSLNATFKVVFIYNPDCEHCQEETPRLRTVYDQWKSRGVEVFSLVANAKNREEWLNFGKKYGVNWTDVYDPQLESRFHEKYFVDITPEVYVLDKNNKIIAKNLKPNQLPELFESELAKMK
ncbi:MAG: redoxin domain-containing protein [Saprospiraceae bacterium]|nr:redoxin domain-containing protein [Saprospiraceae bacterium]